mgnify:CR=1 FL=1
MTYDKENIFAKIIRGEIPCDKIYEDAYALSFEDIRPQAPSHALVIPKGEYIDINDFSSNASDEEIIGLNRAIGVVADKLGISEQSGGNGYRLIANSGKDGLNGEELEQSMAPLIQGQIIMDRLRHVIFDNMAYIDKEKYKLQHKTNMQSRDRVSVLLLYCMRKSRMIF